jgi:alpha-tubulin suppressor-like RCC1 family protein
VTVSGLLFAGPVAIAAGDHHSCIRTGAGGAKCWGYNGHGELGNGSATYSFATPTDVIDIDGVGPLINVTAIAAGVLQTCAIVSGNGYCWGDNTYGQLGTNTTTGSRKPVSVQGLSGVTSIDAGGWHGCAALTDHTVRCWGSNGYGQLGNGVFGESTTPVTVSGLTTATAIALGEMHSCALVDTGAVWCWGDNTQGQLGNGPWYPTPRQAPTTGIALP